MTDVRTDGFLAPAFRDFYAFLSDARAEVEANPWQFSKRAGESWEEKAAAPALAAARVRDQLRGFLKRQSMQLGRWAGEEGNVQLDGAQYVMASLADEVFVNLEWEGHEVWAHDLLETHMFSSHVAGERLFERAEALLRGGRNSDRELALIYLWAICLGFQGPPSRDIVPRGRLRMPNYTGISVTNAAISRIFFLAICGFLRRRSADAGHKTKRSRLLCQ